MTGDKKARRQRAKAAMRERAAREWDEHMVIEPAQLKELLDHLDEALGRADCDHSLRFTRAWAVENGIGEDALKESVFHFAADAIARSWPTSTRRRRSTGGRGIWSCTEAAERCGYA